MLILFQAPFNRVSYSIIGDDNAPSLFQIDSNTGQITYATNTNINLDSTSIYRVRISPLVFCYFFLSKYNIVLKDKISKNV